MRLIICGDFFGDLFDTGKERRIDVNLHDDMKWQERPAYMASVVHHETIHDQGFQIAEELHYNNRLTLGNLTHDALLWVAFKAEKATISPRIYSAYREQFHEAVAFDQQQKFRIGVECILAEGQHLPVPVAA